MMAKKQLKRARVHLPNLRQGRHPSLGASSNKAKNTSAEDKSKEKAKEFIKELPKTANGIRKYFKCHFKPIAPTKEWWLFKKLRRLIWGSKKLCKVTTRLSLNLKRKMRLWSNLMRENCSLSGELYTLQLLKGWMSKGRIFPIRKKERIFSKHVAPLTG